MRRHKISEELVGSVIDNPDSQTPTIKGRTNAAKAIEGRIIRVTYVREEAQTSGHYRKSETETLRAREK